MSESSGAVGVYTLLELLVRLRKAGSSLRGRRTGVEVSCMLKLRRGRGEGWHACGGFAWFDVCGDGKDVDRGAPLILEHPIITTMATMLAQRLADECEGWNHI